jgi:hypothetical protein
VLAPVPLRWMVGMVAMGGEGKVDLAARCK